jgi:hypothetical protein
VTGASEVGADVAVAEAGGGANADAGGDADADGDAEADEDAEADGAIDPDAVGERRGAPDAEERGAGARNDATGAAPVAAAARGSTTGVATTLGRDDGTVATGGLSVGITGAGTAAASRAVHAAMVLGRAATTTRPTTAVITTAPTIHARFPEAGAGFSSVAAHGDAV